MEDVRDKVAVITGGASGIGLGIASAFGAAGARVVLADVEAGALESACRVLSERGVDAMPVVVDVTSRDELSRARDRICAAMGGVHLLFNNAGVNAPGPVTDLTYRDWDWVMGVNLGGVINGVMTFLPELLRHPGEAHLVNTASVGGLVGMPGLAIYNTSKFAVVGLSEALRADLRGAGVGVSVLCPGIVATALGASERNRPAHLANEGARAVAAVESAEVDHSAAIGTSPEILGEQVLAGVREGRFFICTHDEFRDIVAERNQALMSGFAGGGEPAQAEAMRRLVVPF